MSIHGFRYSSSEKTRKLEESVASRDTKTDAKLLAGRYLKIYGLL